MLLLLYSSEGSISATWCRAITNNYRSPLSMTIGYSVVKSLTYLNKILLSLLSFSWLSEYMHHTPVAPFCTTAHSELPYQIMFRRMQTFCGSLRSEKCSKLGSETKHNICFESDGLITINAKMCKPQFATRIAKKFKLSNFQSYSNVFLAMTENLL